MSQIGVLVGTASIHNTNLLIPMQHTFIGQIAGCKWVAYFWIMLCVETTPNFVFRHRLPVGNFN